MGFTQKRRNGFGFAISEHQVCTGKKIMKESNLELALYIFPVYYLLLILPGTQKQIDLSHSDGHATGSNRE